MAKIKHTKNELKAQNEALSRFQRFLPMLQLKKQQLQAEIQTIDTKLDEKQAQFDSTMNDIKKWAALFAEPVDISELVRLDKIETDSGNIAGVNIPIIRDVRLTLSEIDIFETPTWLDDAQESISALTEMKAEIEVLEEQRSLIKEELRTTSQRVNLFEKVKIPECKENIRTIKIFLGDEQTAAVARGKLAKKRTEGTE
jgi:V/A-type H+-transporting ATPase subunit D